MDEDYIRFQVPWYRQTNRTSAAFETALCKRQSGTLSPSKRTFVKIRKSNSPRTAKRTWGAGNRLFNTLRKFQRVASPIPNVNNPYCR